jgi:hypothetical protein
LRLVFNAEHQNLWRIRFVKALQRHPHSVDKVPEARGSTRASGLPELRWATLTGANVEDPEVFPAWRATESRAHTLARDPWASVFFPATNYRPGNARFTSGADVPSGP